MGHTIALKSAVLHIYVQLDNNLIVVQASDMIHKASVTDKVLHLHCDLVMIRLANTPHLNVIEHA